MKGLENNNNHGRFGSFRGCPNYPKCKFTTKF
ncbi:MAG: topoisomerase DNA-binding C4 zinc finger domain-containing protein [Prevotella sp.]|nr:topoisomerase DNA-binding C4 zinc finger domain-containing protein [Prevotella sp.]